MINLKQEQRERVTHDLVYLRQVLEDEVAQLHFLLESSPLEKVQYLQGKVASLKEVIELLP